MRVKGVCFSNNRRAIVLPDNRSVEEDMPMVEGVRFDKRMGDLIAVLTQDPDVTVEAGTASGPPHVLLRTPQGTARVPAKYEKASFTATRSHLRAIGLTIPADPVRPGQTRVIDVDAPLPVPSTRDWLGFEMSQTTGDVMTALMMTMRVDVEQEIQKRITVAVDEAIATLSDGEDWKAIAERYERELGELKKERDAAVRDLVRQRDEEMARASAAEQQLATIRQSLSGLSGLFKEPA